MRERDFQRKFRIVLAEGEKWREIMAAGFAAVVPNLISNHYQVK